MENIVSYSYKISREDRRRVNKHNSFLVFFTGLSGAGKSTLVNALEKRLYKESVRTYVLDGDNVRKGINKNLSFSPKDRSENNRRIGEISKLFIDAGLVVLAAFVSPYSKDRNDIKHTVGTANFIEVYVSTSLEICEQRDVKGLYKKARAGEITNMTGISSPYEAPINPDVEVSHLNSIDEAVDIIYKKVKRKLILKSYE